MHRLEYWPLFLVTIACSIGMPNSYASANYVAAADLLAHCERELPSASGSTANSKIIVLDVLTPCTGYVQAAIETWLGDQHEIAQNPNTESCIPAVASTTSPEYLAKKFIESVQRQQSNGTLSNDDLQKMSANFLLGVAALEEFDCYRGKE